MLFAGIAWTATGFEVAFHDEAGAAPPGFTAGAAGELVRRLVDLDAATDHQLVCVVDSTQGMVDGGLLSHGVRVHRADPWQLPPRPDFGSIDAETLAVTGARHLADLPRLVLAEGSLTARDLASGDPAPATDIPARCADARRCWSRLEALPEEKAVALTFDDGPNPPWTDRILDVLDRYEVPATFFCVGLQARGHQEHLSRMSAAGHTVGNHTWSHPLLTDLAAAEVTAQVDRTSETIALGTGGRRPSLFRPPYGVSTATPSPPGQGDSAMDTVLWDVDTQDWAMPGVGAIAGAVLEQARPGSIVLMHDGGGDRSQTAAALPVIIEGLLARGFRFVSLRGHGAVPGPEAG